MGRDSKKALVAQGAGVVVGLATGHVGPLVNIVIRGALGAISRTNQQRVEALLAAAIDCDEPEEFTERLNQAFIEEDPEVLAAFAQAARSAMKVVDDVAIPSIGLLFRRAMTPTLEPLAKWKERAYLSVLEEVTLDEFVDLRAFLHGVLAAPQLMAEPERTEVPVCPGRSDGNGHEIITAIVATAEEEQTALCVVRDPQRVFQLLKANRLAEGPRGAATVEFDLIRPLAEVMPLPTPVEASDT